MLMSEKAAILSFVGSIAFLFVLEAGLLARLVAAKVMGRKVKTGRAAWGIHILATTVLLCAAYAYWVEPYWIEVSHVTVKTSNLHSGRLRIVQFSDTHCETKLRNEVRLVEIVNEAKADIVVFNGDSLNTMRALGTFKDVLGRMHARIGKYAVRGNFDSYFWPRADLFGGTGFVEMNSHNVFLDEAGGKIVLTGASCLAPDAYKALLSEVPEGAFSIFLYHYPDLIEDVAGHTDLYLAGHTHGGQIALPFSGAIVTLSRHGKKYEAGRYDIGGTTLYINRGIGMEKGPAPRMRFLARPEVTIIDIVPASPAGGE